MAQWKSPCHACKMFQVLFLASPVIGPQETGAKKTPWLKKMLGNHCPSDGTNGLALRANGLALNEATSFIYILLLSHAHT